MAGAERARDLLDAVDAALADWTPDALLISAGFDSLHGDPLGGFTLRVDDIHGTLAQMKARANEDA